MKLCFLDSKKSLENFPLTSHFRRILYNHPTQSGVRGMGLPWVVGLIIIYFLVLGRDPQSLRSSDICLLPELTVRVLCSEKKVMGSVYVDCEMCWCWHWRAERSSYETVQVVGRTKDYRDRGPKTELYIWCLPDIWSWTSYLILCFIVELSAINTYLPGVVMRIKWDNAGKVLSTELDTC